MARWRAVPTAVSTAVGALAFLASTGLAIVLGAGLHVWSGPATPGGLTGHAPSGSSAVTGRVGGVVTVAPPATTSVPAPSVPGAPTPTVALPFVPFVPVTTPSSGAAAPDRSGPAVSAPVADRPRPEGPDSVRALLPRHALRPSRATGTDELLTSSARKAMRLARDNEVSVRSPHRHQAHARHHGRHDRDAEVDVRGHRHGHRHGHGHQHGHGAHHHHGHHHGPRRG